MNYLAFIVTTVVVCQIGALSGELRAIEPQFKSASSFVVSIDSSTGLEGRQIKVQLKGGGWILPEELRKALEGFFLRTELSMKEFLQCFGVPFLEGSKVEYDQSSGKLQVLLDEQSLELVKTLLRRYAAQEKPITVNQLLAATESDNSPWDPSLYEEASGAASKRDPNSTSQPIHTRAESNNGN